MPIIAVRCVGGRERAVADMLAISVKNEGLPVQAILYTEKLSGYIFVETTNPSMIREFIGKIKYAKGVVETVGGGINFVSLRELEHYIKPKPSTALLKIGDTVQVIKGFFKGRMGRVKRIDKKRGEVMVVLLDVGYDLPIIMPATYLEKTKEKKRD